MDPTLPSPIASKYNEKPAPKREMSVKEILASPNIRPVFRNYFLLSVAGTAFDVVFILLAYTPVHLGGLSRTVSTENILKNRSELSPLFATHSPTRLGMPLPLVGWRGR